MHQELRLLLFGMAVLIPASIRAVVISEIYYHPRAGEENLEFVEVSSDSSTPEDLSGYQFTEGIEFTFPAATILLPGAAIAVCADVNAVQTRYGLLAALGNFVGKLDNSGETIALVNSAGIVLQKVSYKDRGKWPVGPDGAAHSLVLRAAHLDSGEPESWGQSAGLGGHPGWPGFPASRPQLTVEVLIDKAAAWRYAKGTQAYSTPETAWKEPGFDDSGWLEGPSGFGFADNDDATVLGDMAGLYTTVAIRKHLSLSAEELAAPGDFFLAVDCDDGFVAYCNGREVARLNAGKPGVDPLWNGVATARREAGKEGDPFLIPQGALSSGDNVFALIGFNFRATDDDFTLVPRVLKHLLVAQEAPVRPLVVFNELYRGASAGLGWVELHNAGSSTVDLSGIALTDDPGRAQPYRFPGGSSMAPHGFLVIDEGAAQLDLSVPKLQLFLLALDGFAVAASTHDREVPAGLPTGEFSEARFPDGGPEGWVTRTPTRGLPNEVERVTDVVINEIFYHPPLDRRGEFLELYNRGKESLDLSGFRFDKGIDFTIPQGTRIAADGYLVVAEDPALLQANHGEASLGPYAGQLSNRGENVRLVDTRGNLVSEVRYADGGRWSAWADAGGSSLELIDPDQNLSVPAAWDASDEEEKAPWEQHSFHVKKYSPGASSELHLLLAERGFVNVDDVSITRAGGDNLIPNPGFETATTPWVIQGTHIRSRRITTDFHTGTACLEINASGKGDTLVNRIETDTKPNLTSGAYDVSLWARWRRGGSLLLVHGDYVAGNSMAAAFSLTVPWNLGTPGAENSVRKRLRLATGSGNQGPVIDRVRHNPIVPLPNMPVTITARAQDSLGVASVQVYYRDTSALGDFLSAELLDDGAHSDGAAGDGIFGGEIPASAVVGTKRVFYVEAIDSAGATGRFPVDAPARTCLYIVADPPKAGLATVRTILDAARTRELETRALHSNDLLDGTMIFNDSEVYYNVGIRYRGSPWGRPARGSFRVKFQADEPFHRGRKAINLSSRGSSANEGTAYWLAGRSGVPGSPAPAQDYSYVRAAINGSKAFITYGIIQPIDVDFLLKWYGDAGNGPVLKVEGRRLFGDSEDLQYEGATLIYRGEDKENYRHYFIPGFKRSLDLWQPFIDLCRMLDKRSTPDVKYDAELETVLDVEEFLRIFSARMLAADGDTLGVGGGHNAYLVVDPRDGRWELLPFDVDGSFTSSFAVNLFPQSDSQITRLLQRPWVQRIYFRVLEDYIDGYFSPVRAKPFLDAVRVVAGVDTVAILDFMKTSQSFVKSTIRPGTSAAFKIVTNTGQDLLTDSKTTVLEGDAPVKAALIAYRRNGGALVTLKPSWTSPVRWKATLDLPEGTNFFEFFGLDRQENVVGKASITVTTLALPGNFVRGDSGGDRKLSLTDAIVTLRHLFQGGDVPSCRDAADFDDNGKLDLPDALGCLDYLFREGPPPPLPFPGLGPDPTEDTLDCKS